MHVHCSLHPIQSTTMSARLQTYHARSRIYSISLQHDVHCIPTCDCQKCSGISRTEFLDVSPLFNFIPNAVVHVRYRNQPSLFARLLLSTTKVKQSRPITLGYVTTYFTQSQADICHVSQPNQAQFASRLSAITNGKQTNYANIGRRITRPIFSTRKLSYRKDHRAMRPIYGCPTKF